MCFRGLRRETTLSAVVEIQEYAEEGEADSNASIPAVLVQGQAESVSSNG